MKYLQDYNGSAEDLAQLFGINKNSQLVKTFEKIIKKKFQTYFFDRQEKSVYVKDISSLDAANTDEAVANSGGPSDFSSGANEMVSKLVANER